MDKPKTELADLDQPLEEITPEQAAEVRGGSTSTTSTTTKPSTSELTVPKSTDVASAKLF